MAGARFGNKLPETPMAAARFGNKLPETPTAPALPQGPSVKRYRMLRIRYSGARLIMSISIQDSRILMTGMAPGSMLATPVQAT